MVFADNIALIENGEQLTYAQLAKRADAVSCRVPRRSVVFLIATNTIPSVAAYVGFLMRHVVVVMIREETSSAQLSALVNAYKPQFLWAPEGFEGLDGIRTGHFVYADNNYLLLPTGFDSYPVNPDLALLLTTSGSTGTPKYVRLSYSNVRANAESIAEYQEITPADRAITTLPFSYSYGISIINSHLISGASIVLSESSLMSRDFWTLIREKEATNFGGVPYTYQMLERLRFDKMELPNLRFVSQAGGRLGDRLHEWFSRVCLGKGIDFFVMYGQTEATARMSWLPPEQSSKKIGSIGIPIPGGRFELHSADDTIILNPGLSGELVYQGPNVSLGYATSKRDLAKGDDHHGILHTGDVAKRDEDGYYYIVGRMKRFLKMFGNRVNLDEIEAFFSKQGIDLACVGSDDHMVVFVSNYDPGKILSMLTAETKMHPRGFDVRTIDEIPHMKSGKIDYAFLESQC